MARKKLTEDEIDNLEYMEACLQDYPANLARIGVLQRDLEVLRLSTDVQAQNYSAVSPAPKTSHSDPVQNFVIRIERLEHEIERLERITAPITRMIQDLKSPYALEGSRNSEFIKILGLHFFGRNPLPVVLDAVGWSRATFFRRKKQLLLLVQRYLGVISPEMLVSEPE